jgi:AT-binding transcription factor 1
LDEQIAKDFPELAKATCQYCKKVFSSVWILKSHCEEIHQNVISMEILENFAEAFRGEYLKKVEAAEAAGEKDAEDSKETAPNPKNTSSSNAEQGGGVVPTAPSTPTASTTPASSADSVSGNNSASAAGHGSSNIPMSLAQHMNDVQNAINAMAASQLQNFNPMLHPMMMASLGMGLPLGLNMNALAAMNLQPPLVPMMMPPQFDQMNQMNQNMQNQNSQYQQQRLDPNSLAKQQQQILQQQQASASQQKRARTRITGIFHFINCLLNQRIKVFIKIIFYTDDQLKILRAHFDINNSPSEDQIQQMAQQSGLPPKVIKHWFR